MWKNIIRTEMFNANICILCDVVKKENIKRQVQYIKRKNNVQEISYFCLNIIS